MIDSIGFADKIIGKVILIGDTWAIESAENGHLQRYVPIGDDNSWKSEGQEIVFSGVIGKPDPNVRMIGNPLEVREWRKLYRAQPTDEH